MKKLKQVSQKRLDEIEYAIASTVMETNATPERIEALRQNLLKVETGEWTDEEYWENVFKKYKKS